jgi:hypothetical protein
MCRKHSIAAMAGFLIESKTLWNMGAMDLNSVAWAKLGLATVVASQ